LRKNFQHATGAAGLYRSASFPGVPELADKCYRACVDRTKPGLLQPINASRL